MLKFKSDLILDYDYFKHLVEQLPPLFYFVLKYKSWDGFMIF